MTDDATPTVTQPKTRLFGMQISEELDQRISESARTHNLTKSGIARLAIERGLLVVNEALGNVERGGK